MPTSFLQKLKVNNYYNKQIFCFKVIKIVQVQK